MALVALATGAVFLRTLGHEYTNWDDRQNLTDNPLLNPPTLRSLGEIWAAPYLKLYIPLVYSSYWLERAAGGGPWLTFLVNTVLHAAAGCLVWRIGVRLLSGNRWPDLAPDHGTALAALAGALVFALHPVQVEAVAWATGRKDVLAGLLAAAALLLHLRAAERGAGRPAGRFRTPDYWLGMLAFALALASKPGAVAIPLAVWALDVWALGTGAVAATLAALPGLAIAAGFTVVTMGVQPIPGVFAPAYTAMWTRPLVAADALTFYAGRVAAPFSLAAIYGRTPAVAMAGWWPWAALPLVACAAFLVLRRRGNGPAALAVAVAFLLPVLGLIPFLFQSRSTVADRYLYPAMIGTAMAVAAAVRHLLATRPGAGRRIGPAIAAGALLLGGLSWVQAGEWRNSETLWRHNIAAAPSSPSGYVNLANALIAQKRYDEALAAAGRALELDPASYTALANRGLALVQTGRVEEGLAAMQKAAETAPEDSGTRLLYADALSRAGRDAGARVQFEKVLAADPRNGVARMGLATVLANSGDLPAAVAAYRQVLDERPGLPAVHSNLGYLLAQLGKPDEALTHLREAVRLNPADRQAAAELRQLENRTLPAAKPRP